MADRDVRAQLSQEADQLRRVRDELRVQLHLGKAEVKERWEKAEKDWEHFEGRLKVLGEAAEETLEEIGGAAQLLADEIKSGYKHLKSLV